MHLKSYAVRPDKIFLADTLNWLKNTESIRFQYRDTVNIVPTELAINKNLFSGLASWKALDH